VNEHKQPIRLQARHDRKRDSSGAYEDVSEADITPPEQEQSTKGELYG